jgi:hypothetical protein
VIENATISAITPAGAPDRTGKIVYASPTAISVRANFGQASTYQQSTNPQLYEKSAGVLRVLKSKLPAGVAPTDGCQIRVTVDGGGPLQVLVATKVMNWEKLGGLAHYECVLENRS